MSILLTAAMWLVITVHGEVKHQAGPMTADACALQMAFHLLQAQRIAAQYGSVMVDGRVVTLDDVEVRCLPGERAS